MKAMGWTGLKTYRAALNEGLTALVGLYEQGEVRGLRRMLHRDLELVRERRSRDGPSGPSPQIHSVASELLGLVRWDCDPSTPGVMGPGAAVSSLQSTRPFASGG